MMAEPNLKKLKKDDENSVDEEKFNIDSETYFLDHLISPFEMPNLTIKIENQKLHVKKEQMMAASPVFEKMFSSNFKESTATEITLPGKKLSHFIHFLRYMLPGFPDALTTHTVHHILPLAEEYQVDTLLTRIDEFLAKEVEWKGDKITSEEIVKNILEAQQYNLSNYKESCIAVASRKKIENLVSIQNFNDIDKTTQIQIHLKRCRDIDSVFNKADIEKEVKDRWGSVVMRTEWTYSEVGSGLKPYMQSN